MRTLAPLVFPAQPPPYVATTESVFVSGGTAIWRLHESTCEWEEVYRIPMTPGGAAYESEMVLSRVVDLQSVEQGAATSVFAVLASGAPCEGSVTYRLAVSHDGGEPGSWEIVESPLPVLGPRFAFKIAPSDPSTMYLLTAPSPYLVSSLHTHHFLFATSDGGQSWALRPPVSLLARQNLERCPAQLHTNPAIIKSYGQGPGLIVDPRNPAVVWAWGSSSYLFRSEDAGETMSRLRVPWREPDGGGVLHDAAIASVRRRGDRIVRSRLVVSPVDASGHAFFWTDDDGKTWTRRLVPDIPFSDITVAGNGRRIVGSVGHYSNSETWGPLLAAEGVYEFDIEHSTWLPINPSYPAPVMGDLSAAGGFLYGTSESALYRRREAI